MYSVHYTELEGPIIVLVCEPHGTNQAEVEVPARLLAKFSDPIALVAALDSWDPPTNQVIGRLTLPGIDATLAKQVVSYLKGECFEVSAMVRSGDKTSKRNVVRAVQASSIAHVLGINELQRGAMHTLLHFLVIYKQVLSGDELRLELGRLFPGCPAQLILHACLHHEEGEEPEPSPSEAPGVAGWSKGLRDAKGLLAAALNPDATWDWKALKMSTWKSMSKNRGLEELWNESEPFLASRKTFTQARAKFTDADPFWRLGGARGAVLGSHFPSWWPRLSAKDLESERERWQAALPPIKARSKKKEVPAIIVTPSTPETAKMPRAVESLPRHQPNVEVESTSDAPYVKDQKVNNAEGSSQDDVSESLQPLPKSVVEDEDLVEISEAEWRLHQSSQQNVAAPR